MKTWRPRHEWLEQLAFRAAAADPPPGDDPMPDDVQKWLAQLSLLHGVPFAYLVPDWRMLPPESMRFFVVDPNWISRLIDGALSIAQTSTASALYLERISPEVHRRVGRAALRVRSDLRRVAPPAQAVEGGTLSGLLLRSAVVTGWPGLEVHPYAQKQLLEIARMDRPSPDVLLVLIKGVPDEVDLVEPPEGLHFGAVGAADRQRRKRRRSAKGAAEQLVVDLRGLGIGGFPAGKPISGAIQAVTTRRGSYANVVQVGPLADGLQSQLSQKKALGPNGFTSAEFAIQMVKSAEVQPYQPAAVHGRRRSAR